MFCVDRERVLYTESYHFVTVSSCRIRRLEKALVTRVKRPGTAGQLAWDDPAELQLPGVEGCSEPWVEAVRAETSVQWLALHGRFQALAGLRYGAAREGLLIDTRSCQDFVGVVQGLLRCLKVAGKLQPVRRGAQQSVPEQVSEFGVHTGSLAQTDTRTEYENGSGQSRGRGKGG